MDIGRFPDCDVIIKNNNLIKIHLYKPERKDVYVNRLEFILLCAVTFCVKSVILDHEIPAV